MSEGAVHVPCPLCGRDCPELLFAARGTTAAGDPSATFDCTSPHLGDHGPVVRCTACSMVYADPRPTPVQLRAAYARVHDPEYQVQRRGRELTFAAQVRTLCELVEPPAELLDVGCYTGVFMEVAAGAGFSVRGTELSAWAAEQARSLAVGEVLEAEVLELDLAPSSVDVVTMWDVLEHLPDPVAAVRKAAGLLRPGGVLALSTHLIDSPAARLLGTRYPFLMDMHLVHFSRATLHRLLHEAGFTGIRIDAHRRCVMLDYLLGRIASMVPASRRLLAPLARGSFARRRPVWVRGLGLINAYGIRRPAP
jgi:SAM-dependent methyltransferase